MDNPSQESSNTLNLNQAGSLFSDMIDPVEKEPETPEAAAERLATEEAARPETEAETTEEGAHTIPVEVDGKTIELTKEQIAEAYKNGLRQADYTKKTMEVSEQRKAAESEIAAARQERQQYAERLNVHLIQLQGVLQEQSQINWQQLLDADPVEYLKQQHLFQQRQAAYQNAQQEQGKIWQQQQAENTANQQAYLAKQQDELLAKLPEWKDANKAKAEKEQLRTYLQDKLGFSPEHVAGVQDHRAVLMARKAMLYDSLMERAQTATKRVAPLPTKVERPGNGDSKPQDGRTEAMKRLSKSGRMEDAAAIFSSML